MERRYVRLTADEEERYVALTAVYEQHVADAGYRERTPSATDAWRLFAAAARRSPQARRAFRAFHDRERIVRRASAKLLEAERILRLHPAEQAVLFCGGTDTAEAVSRAFGIPMIAAWTPASERHALLKAMDRGDIRAVASVRVLDEGWDVPGA
jgi:superfamily II DNA or RNA helicase